MAVFAQQLLFGPFTVNGTIINGPKLYHYIAGTTTLLNIYSDRAKTTTLAQPFIGDTRGELQFYGDGVYKMVVQDANSNVLYTIDNFNIAEPPLLGKGATITAAATLVLGTDGNFFHVAGATGITAISGTASYIFLTFDATPILTHNSTSLILLGALNHTPSVGETMIFLNEGAGNWRELGKSATVTLTGPNTFTGLNVEFKSANIASAATTDLSTATGNYVHVTGSTGPITSLGTLQAGARIHITFDSTPTLTHNATSLILPGKANIVCEANDTALFESEGAGNWRCMEFIRANGRNVFEVQGTTIASSATTDLSTATGQYIQISGTNTITALGTMAAGTVRILEFQGALTFTHNATTLILPNNAANITTVAGDMAVMVSEGAGNWRCVHYTVGGLRPRVKVGSFTYDVSTASGTTTITGVGFTPRLIHFDGNIPSITGGICWGGRDDGTNRFCMYSRDPSSNFQHAVDTSNSIRMQILDADRATAVIAFNSDGGTLTWTKTGTPTGTATIGYTAFE